ncbi:hypothetical protein TNCV_1941201 [Trichonephila clavipes]|uniref:Uncharacterized protein n=1 Tax=Trichonephila clavipes TaxID=2585209 RepID=A0A8X6SDD5_TRICX|nr:hypothetical protein TNCV_1941201 [Trichonephila clavipes]
MKCLARALSVWCDMHDVLSPAQKGFLPHDRVIEHNFLLTQHLEEARRNHGNAKPSSCPFPGEGHGLRGKGSGQRPLPHRWKVHQVRGLAFHSKGSAQLRPPQCQQGATAISACV